MTLPEGTIVHVLGIPVRLEKPASISTANTDLLRAMLRADIDPLTPDTKEGRL